MEPRLLKIFIFAFLIYCVSARQYRGRSKYSGTFQSHQSYQPPRQRSPTRTTGTFPTFPSRASRPSSTSVNLGKTSSASFLHAESGRPSLPANPNRPKTQTYNPPSHYEPSAPSLHSISSSGKPSSVVNERHQQTSAPLSHSKLYERQPAQNPYLSNTYGSHGTATGSHSPPPYPAYQPNHPLPTNGLHYPPTNGAHYPAPTNGAHYPPTNGLHYPPTNGAHYPAPTNGAHYPSTNGLHYPPTNGAHYPAPMNGAHYPPTNGVHYPPTYSHQPPAQTIYVIPDSQHRYSSSHSGSGLGIASSLANGLAIGAGSSIASHVIGRVLQPNAHGVHTYPSAPAPGTPTTSITNNYYYNDVAPAPAPAVGQSVVHQPAQRPAQTNSNDAYTPALNPPTTANDQGTTVGNINKGPVVRPNNGVVSRTPEQQQQAYPDENNAITDDELMKLTEELFDNLNTNINQYVELNLQKRVAGVTDGPLSDEANEPLFIVKPGLDSILTVSKLKALYDSYQRNDTQKEVVSFDRQNKENAFLDEIVKTPVMKKALSWLSEKHYVKPNDYDQKELLRNIWFTTFDGTSSSFKRIFLSENLGDNGVIGLQNWIYVAHLEGKNEVDYMGYIDILSLSGKGALLKANLKTAGVTLQALTMFSGTPPELEMALYTVCMHARYLGYCPISLGGAKFFIYTHDFKQNNNYLIAAGFPTF